MSAPEHMVPLRSIHNPAMVVEQIKVVKGTPSCFRCCGTSRLNVHTSTLLGINPLVVHRVDQLAGRLEERGGFVSLSLRASSGHLILSDNVESVD
jgi:hypothetical protein